MNGKTLIILGYYNGKKYIDEQLESLVAQVGVKIDVIIFDDCSDQESKNKLQKIEQNFDVTVINREKNLGFARNFIDGLIDCPPYYDYYALCDQDDVWMPNKLSRAQKMLEDSNGGISMYCSNHTLVNSDNQVTRSNLRKKVICPCFENALVENIAAGNTIVINRETRDKLTKLNHSEEIPAHDWWLYLLVTAIGGKVIFDQNSAINYRQHSTNALGANYGLTQKFRRVVSLLRGQYRLNILANIKLVERNSVYLEERHAKTFEHFKNAVNSSSTSYKIRQLKKSKVFRQAKLETWVIRFVSHFGIV